MRMMNMSINYEGSILKLMRYGDTREIDTPGIGRSDTPTASGLPMPIDPKKRAKQVDRDIGSKYTPQLEDLPANIQNTLSKAVRRKKDQPAKDIPVSDQRKHLRRMKEYLEHFSAINSDRVLQATAFDDMAAQYERLYGMKNVGKIKYPSPLVPSNKLTLEHDSSKKLEGQHTHETHHFPAAPNTFVSYNLPKDDKDGNPYHGSHTDGDHTFPVNIDHDKDTGSVVASFGGLNARLDLDSFNQDHHDTAKAEKYPKYAALKPTEISIKRDVTPANTQAHVEDLQRQRQTNPTIDYRMGNTGDTSVENAMLKLIKEGAAAGGDGGDGGGFDGLSGTVFTSTNAGIFNPTHGGSKTKKRYRKQHKKQEKRRKKLLGKEKKSGVDRLVQFLYDGSPMKKARKPDKDMTGDGATAHAWNNKRSGRKILDWNKVANDNTPNSHMGNAGPDDATSRAACYPQEEDTSNNMKTTQRKADWGDNNYYVQKELKPLIKLGSSPQLWNGPNGNTPTESFESGNGTPQKAFIERDKDYETPGKDAVTKQNDSDRKIKDHDNKEDEKGNVHQPEAAMATKGMGNYPSSALQMAAFGSGPDSFAQDQLGRGGDRDIGHEEDDIDEKKRTNVWVSEEDIKKFDKLYKALKDANDDTPLITALHKVFNG